MSTEEIDQYRPPNWDQWDREAKVNYYSLGKTRAELLTIIREVIDSNQSTERLTKDEIAGVLIAVED